MEAAEESALPQNLVFVDLETTGGNAAYHRITEVGIVLVAGGEFVEEWSSLVNPECRIPPGIEAFTGITNEMVAGAPRFRDIADEVLGRLQGRVFVAHNARFDYSFLRTELRRVDRRFGAKVLCTVKLSRRLFPEQARHNLDAVMARHGLACSARHRALGDARVLWDLWQKLRRELPEAQLADAVRTLCAANALPAHLPPDLADELPEGPGVYRFFGEDDALLYVGKSVSLRTRVLGHFAAEHSDAKEQKLARQVRRVDWIETAGELGALLREAMMVKQLKPLYNRRLKESAQVFTIRLVPQPLIGALDEFEGVELGDCFGLFRTRREAQKTLTEIARAQGLCMKVLGLEAGEGSCFAYQLGRCRGACVGREKAGMHQMRLAIALAALKLKSWPFAGRIALRERDGMGGCDLHLLDQWTYLGTARSEDEMEQLCGTPRPARFDPDMYRILARHLASKERLDWMSVPARTANS
jgi:DNA polymerase-3 subunit epsilon